MLLGIRWSSLRLKIVAWSLIPTTIIFVAVALVGFYAYQRITEDLVFERNRELARRVAGQLAAALTEYTNDLNTVARTADVSSGQPSLQQAALKQASNRLIVFDAGVIILDNHGVVVAAQPERPDAIGQDWSNRAYFRQLAHAPSPVFSDVTNDGPAHEQVVVVAVPITGPQSEFIGTLAGMFRLGATNISSFYATIVKLRIGADDKAFLAAYLVDQGGWVIYHSDNQQIRKSYLKLPAVQSVLTGKSNALRTRNPDGQEIVASFAPVTGTSWGLVTEISWDVLLSSSQGYRQFLLLLLALGIILPAIVIAIGVGRLTKPIVALTAAARQVAGGDFGQTVTADTGDELEDLATQFNLMSARLSESYLQLSERQEQLELTMQGTNDGFWDWNIRTSRVYFSRRWKSMLGYEEEEIADNFDAWRQLIHPDDLARVLATLQDYLDGRTTVYYLEHLLRHKDGSYRWILARGIALRDVDGQPYRMAGSHTDITESKHAEQEIRRQNTYLAALHETALAVVGHRDVNELLEAIVQRAVQLVGANYGWVYLITEDKEAIEVKVGTGLFRQYVGLRLSPGEGLAGKIWQTGEPLAVDDYHAWSGRSPHYEQERIGAAMGVPLKFGAEIVGVTGLTRSPSEPPFSQVEVDLMTRLAQLASIALENARLHTSRQAELDERVRAEAALQEAQKAIQSAYQTLEQRVQERTHELATLNAIAAVVSRSLDLQEIMSDALDKLLEIMNMEYGGAYRLEGDADDAMLHPLVYRGMSDEFVQEAGLVPVQTLAVELAVASGRPHVWTVHDSPATPEMKRYLEKEQVRQVISIPLLAKGRLVGAIQIGTRQVRSFAPEQLALLGVVGQQVGVAVENARLYDQAEQSAALAERNRLARELHDSVTQSLYSVTLYAEAAARLLTAGQSRMAADHLRDLRDTAQEALREMRLLIFELRPPTLEKSGLVAALQARLDSVEGRGGVQAQLDVEGAERAERVPSAIQEELYQIAREALNNILKHGHAQHVHIRVEFQDATTSLEIHDDGIGFDVEQVQDKGGMGLTGMGERAIKIGAELQVTSAPGQGTTVRVTVGSGAIRRNSGEL